MPLLPGDKLGRHEILAAIGAGGMGEVYKARGTMGEIAAKCLRESAVERFQEHGGSAGGARKGSPHPG